MKKEKITFDQLAVLSFTKFAKLDGFDMTLLRNYLSDVVEISFDDNNENYFIMNDGTILLEQNYINRFYRNVDISLFEHAIETQAYKRLDKIDMLVFILKKIKLIGAQNLAKDALTDDFSEIQIRFINKLYQLEYIMDYTQKDKELGEYQAIKLTQKGEVYLYLKEHATEIQTFANLLSENNYKLSLIELFLINQNLNEDIKNILTLDNFINFCNQFNINPLLNSTVLKKTKSRV